MTISRIFPRLKYKKEKEYELCEDKTYIPSVINFVTSSKYNLDGIFNNIVTFGCKEKQY